MKNYYAFIGEKTILESKSQQTSCTKFQTSSEKFAIKICKNKFGNKKFQLFEFTNFNDNSTFKKII